MKKLVAALIAFMMLLLFAGTACYPERNSFDGPNMTVFYPSGARYHAWGPNWEGEVFQDLGDDFIHTKQFAENADLQLMGTSFDFLEETQKVMILEAEEGAEDFDTVNDADLLAMGKSISESVLSNAPAGQTIRYSDISIDKYDNATYISLGSTRKSGGNSYAHLQKYTCKNGYFITFIFVSHKDSAFTPDQLKRISAYLDNKVFFYKDEVQTTTAPVETYQPISQISVNGTEVNLDISFFVQIFVFAIIAVLTARVRFRRKTGDKFEEGIGGAIRTFFIALCFITPFVIAALFQLEITSRLMWILHLLSAALASIIWRRRGGKGAANGGMKQNEAIAPSAFEKTQEDANRPPDGV